MGGKRSDQYNIDPAEGSSTNHQWRGEGRSADEHLMDKDKQELQSNPHDQPMIPRAGTNPAAREIQERKAAGKETGKEKGEEPRGANDRTANDRGADDRSADDRVDEALEASFPASDPPTQP